MAKGASISAVVISYHGIDFIADCLTTLEKDLEGYDSEIIVIDNHSTDGTVEYIEKHHPDIQLIKNTVNLGFAKAVNQGFKAATKEFIWMLNQDIRIRPGCLDALLSFYEKASHPGMIGPKLVGFDGSLQKFCRRFPRYHHLFFELTGLSYIFPKSAFFNGWKMGEFDHLSSRAVEQPMGAAILLHRDVVSKVGDMDESFRIFFNDVDFCRRLVAHGYTNYYCAEAVIEHYGGGSVSRRKASMVWKSHVGMFKYFLKTERQWRKPLFVKIIRRPLPYLAGLALMIAAVPRSLYHLLRKVI